MINSLVLLYTLLFLNFGIAVIAFTFVVRALMIPLTVRQSRQLKMMADLQPKLKEVQAKFSKDKSKMSQETMKVYKQNGVNPIGCLGPMFIQFPIWIGLYQAIIQTLPSTPEKLVGLSRHLYSWLPGVNEVIPLDSHFLALDLAQPDTSFVMPVLVGVSMFLMQKMTTMPSADPRQAQTSKMMLWMMPLMFGFFTTTFPSGLALYWVISNIVGILIQGFVTGWGPLKDLYKFGRSESGGDETTEQPQPAPALVASSEEAVTDAHDRNNGQNPRRSNRTRPKGTRRRARGSRNRRR